MVTQTQIGEIFGIKQSGVSKLFRGVARPSKRLAIRLEEISDRSWQYFYGKTGLELEAAVMPYIYQILLNQKRNAELKSTKKRSHAQDHSLLVRRQDQINSLAEFSSVPVLTIIP